MFKLIGNKEEAQIEEEQIQAELEKLEAEQCYILLNNTYLELERGDIEMSLHFRLKLEQLASIAYQDCQMMQDYWFEEFQKLPNWLDY